MQKGACEWEVGNGRVQSGGGSAQAWKGCARRGHRKERAKGGVLLRCAKGGVRGGRVGKCVTPGLKASVQKCCWGEGVCKRGGGQSASVQRGRGEDELKVGDKCAKGACKGCAMGVPRPLYALACNRQACKGGGKCVSVQEGKGRTRERGICAVGLQLPCTFRLGGWVCKKKWVCESGCVRVSVHERACKSERAWKNGVNVGVGALAAPCLPPCTLG